MITFTVKIETVSDGTGTGLSVQSLSKNVTYMEAKLAETIHFSLKAAICAINESASNEVTGFGNLPEEIIESLKPKIKPRTNN